MLGREALGRRRRRSTARCSLPQLFRNGPRVIGKAPLDLVFGAATGCEARRRQASADGSWPVARSSRASWASMRSIWHSDARSGELPLTGSARLPQDQVEIGAGERTANDLVAHLRSPRSEQLAPELPDRTPKLPLLSQVLDRPFAERKGEYGRGPPAEPWLGGRKWSGSGYAASGSGSSSKASSSRSDAAR